MSSSHRGPVGIDELPRFDCLIDARSPAEFALDHIPGAINCPVLDDEERRIVGTLYKQEGAFEARRVGGAMVAANLARHLQSEQFKNQPIGWKPLVYCWRGGLRSGSMVQWLRLVGWDAQQLAGGYKRFRQHVMETLDQRCPALPLRVVCGATGSAKTQLLQALARQGAQVLDLEGLACHKGSMLGDLPGQAQPSQKAFDTALYAALAGLDLSQPVYIEAESRKIGRITVPSALLERMRASPCIELRASEEARLEFLLRDYAYLGADGAGLAQILDRLRPSHGHETVNRWQDWARSATLAPLFAELMRSHYDPHYARSQAANFQQWPQRQVLEAQALLPQDIEALAHQLRSTSQAPGTE
ncbi:tRNA 2-selenouridine(34) synthase MnmH [Paucibacter sp. DJ2R-2]|uniref:tRNA 2-selenouridine(34) synthase MnmH n=1 Tax=Paucibacter sp. DJ2R-2 TaxID=2893558 RepID=UPI0021E3679F|nr:tRNA 2-selenouridine(34) synthase MnmH [Paucibacter sp. DJ2R-2]MCV2419026.1 tRNA 2-selenouridine(34) synthase MnmH [Paucibacter sp. DJ4R-1]MCV2438019.1 tRNA 2-selenouridine(34) synthase MnmH [Paucibacter sp. DJ2R-2]